MNHKQTQTDITTFGFDTINQYDYDFYIDDYLQKNIFSDYNINNLIYYNNANLLTYNFFDI